MINIHKYENILIISPSRAGFAKVLDEVRLLYESAFPPSDDA